MVFLFLNFFEFFINKEPLFLNPTVESTTIEVEPLVTDSEIFVFLVGSKLNIKEVESKEISYKSLSSIGLYSTL